MVVARTPVMLTAPTATPVTEAMPPRSGTRRKPLDIRFQVQGLKPGAFQAQGHFESILWKPGDHYISGFKVETRCLSSYGSTAFNY
jgi:hypothetical protein